MDINSKSLKSYALEKLKGNWGVAIGVSFVASILGGNGSTSFGGGASTSSNNSNSILYQPLSPVVTIIVGIIAIWVLVALIIGPTIELGQNTFYLNLCRNKVATFSDLFSKFRYFFKAFALSFVTGLFIMLWSFLLLIPGIIATLKYSMATYILTENPEIGIMQAISESKQMMDGHKLDLLFLNLSFIGWIFLSLLSVGVGFLFLIPYINATTVAFYLKISNTYVDPQYSISDADYIK